MSSLEDFRESLVEEIERSLKEKKKPKLKDLINWASGEKQTVIVLDREGVLSREFIGFPRLIEPSDFQQVGGLEISLTLDKKKVALSALELKTGGNTVFGVCLDQEVIFCWDKSQILLGGKRESGAETRV